MVKGVTQVLFVCEGNKIRSVMAAALYNHITNTSDAMSAGCDRSVEGTPPFAETIAAMKEIGIDVSAYRSTMVTPKMVAGADQVIVFPTPLMPGFVTGDQKTRLWNIADPYYKSGDRLELTHAARDEIQLRIEKLLSAQQEVRS